MNVLLISSTKTFKVLGSSNENMVAHLNWPDTGKQLAYKNREVCLLVQWARVNWQAVYVQTDADSVFGHNSQNARRAPHNSPPSNMAPTGEHREQEKRALQRVQDALYVNRIMM